MSYKAWKEINDYYFPAKEEKKIERLLRRFRALSLDEGVLARIPESKKIEFLETRIKNAEKRIQVQKRIGKEVAALRKTKPESVWAEMAAERGVSIEATLLRLNAKAQIEKCNRRKLRAPPPEPPKERIEYPCGSAERFAQIKEESEAAVLAYAKANGLTIAETNRRLNEEVERSMPYQIHDLIEFCWEDAKLFALP